MDAAQIAAMIADRKAGTPGPWKVFYTQDGSNVIGIGDAESVGVTDPQFGLWRSGKERISNASRIARVPDMEATIIAQAAELERLRAERDALRKVITEGRRAIGDHFAPHDCYATGPMTGDPIRDLVQCPACSFIAMHDTALKGGTQ